jgi:hypothetical protein
MNKNWISVHIFYYGDQNYLLVQSIAPLIASLREQGLIQRYFFIKYWVEGPHIRLRLLPAQGADEDKIKHMVSQAITAFLERHPALYIPREFSPLAKTMFIREYGEEKWRETYGKGEQMPLRPNNSFAFIDYEPEYVRYAGPAGMELSEWHFEQSSDTVIDLLRETNIGVSSMLLGRSVQLALPFFYGIFREDSKVLHALERYILYWTHWQRQGIPEQIYAKKYQRMAPALRQRVAKIRQYMLEEQPSDRLTSVERTWKEHISEFRVRIARLYEEHRIVVPDRDLPFPTSQTLDGVYHYLQGSYVHMTNNRLGVLIPQEVYVAYLLKRTLEDLLTDAVGRKEAVAV